MSDASRAIGADVLFSTRGCDWTLGGLFQFHRTEVERQDGQRLPVFEFASAGNAPGPEFRALGKVRGV